MAVQFKICPRCQIQAPIDAQTCAACGHVYRTQFTQAVALDYSTWLRGVEAELRLRRPDISFSQLDPNALHLAFQAGMTPGAFVAQPVLPLQSPAPGYGPGPQPGYGPQYGPHYGHPGGYQPLPGQYIQLPPGLHSVVPAVVLNLCCITGFGQIYNKQIMKGIVILLSSLCLSAITYGIAGAAIAIAAIVDAYMIARKLEAGRPVGEWEFF